MSVQSRQDQWDHILLAAAGTSDESPAARGSHVRTTLHEPRWGSEVRSSLKEVDSHLDRERTKNRVMAEKMYAVIDREEKLANDERNEYHLRRREIAEGLDGLSEIVGEIISTDKSVSVQTDSTGHIPASNNAKS